MQLVSSVYVPKDPLRKEELKRVLGENLASELFSQVHLFYDGISESGLLNAFPDLEAPQCRLIETRERPAMKILLDCLKGSQDEPVVVANSDILFDPQSPWERVEEISRREVWCLTRYEPDKDSSGDGWRLKDLTQTTSYDAWVFRPPLNGLHAEYAIGTDACDIKLNQELIFAGYRLLNPALDLRTFHIHESQERNWYQGTNPGLGENNKQLITFLSAIKPLPCSLGQPAYRSRANMVHRLRCLRGLVRLIRRPG